MAEALLFASRLAYSNKMPQLQRCLHAADGWREAASESCPLLHWPRNPDELQELGAFLPHSLATVLKSAAAACSHTAARHAELRSTAEAARLALDRALTAAEPLVREFLDDNRCACQSIYCPGKIQE